MSGSALLLSASAGLTGTASKQVYYRAITATMADRVTPREHSKWQQMVALALNLPRDGIDLDGNYAEKHGYEIRHENPGTSVPGLRLFLLNNGGMELGLSIGVNAFLKPREYIELTTYMPKQNVSFIFF